VAGSSDDMDPLCSTGQTASAAPSCLQQGMILLASIRRPCKPVVATQALGQVNRRARPNLASSLLLPWMACNNTHCDCA